MCKKKSLQKHAQTQPNHQRDPTSTSNNLSPLTCEVTPKFWTLRAAQLPRGFSRLKPSGNRPRGLDLLLTRFHQNSWFSLEIWNFTTMSQTWNPFKLFTTNFLEALRFRIWNYMMKSQTGQKEINFYGAKSDTSWKTNQKLEIVTSHDSSKLPAGAKQYCSKKPSIKESHLYKPFVKRNDVRTMPKLNPTTNQTPPHHQQTFTTDVRGDAEILNIARSAAPPGILTSETLRKSLPWARFTDHGISPKF